MTRIISGAAGGLRLQVPRTGTRPTSDRVREALFSALDARDAIRGARVADLYAGSGALGLEAASRGAERVVLVEKAAPAAAVARTNAVRLRGAGVTAEVQIAPREVRAWLSTAAGPFDLVFIDPPYDLTNADTTADLTALVPHLAEDALVVLERSSRDPEPEWPEGLTLDRRTNYGETAVYWLSAS